VIDIFKSQCGSKVWYGQSNTSKIGQVYATRASLGNNYTSVDADRHGTSSECKYMLDTACIFVHYEALVPSREQGRLHLRV
jgi:hypothetical protein